MKTVLIGQAPSRTSDPRRPLSGNPLASTLARLLGTTTPEYLRAFERLNLLDRWPGKNGKGDRFPFKRALGKAYLLAPRLDGSRVVFLGRNVARAFRFDGPFLRWRPHRVYGATFDAAVLPHPSGVNLWWNDRRNKKAAAAFLKKEKGRCKKT